jgi:Tfp pilus assembly protein PilF
MLDRALRTDETLVQAYYWRGLLHKRIDSHSAAMANFRKVVELNPKHMDAVRELRVYEMRIRRNSITMKAVK